MIKKFLDILNSFLLGLLLGMLIVPADSMFSAEKSFSNPVMAITIIGFNVLLLLFLNQLKTLALIEKITIIISYGFILTIFTVNEITVTVYKILFFIPVWSTYFFLFIQIPIHTEKNNKKIIINWNPHGKNLLADFFFLYFFHCFYYNAFFTITKGNFTRQNNDFI